jgi:tetratricopeptide (TPR) repeat protein
MVLPPIFATVVLFAGALVALQGLKVYKARTVALDAYGLTPESPPEPDLHRRIEGLSIAAAILPSNAHIESELGYAYFCLADQHLQWKQSLYLVSQFATSPGNHPLANGLAVGPPVLNWAAQSMPGEDWQGALDQAVIHFAAARNLCPLLAKPQVRIAANLERFARADPRTSYIQRACLVCQWSAELFFLAGVQLLSDNQEESAWKAWRHCLELSASYLGPILTRSCARWPASQIVERIIPENPQLLVQASQLKYPNQDETEQRRPYLERALHILNDRGTKLDATGLHLQGEINAMLSKPAEALLCYGRALKMDPRQGQWRLEYAQLLRQQGRLEEAKQELQRLLTYGPQNQVVRDLLRQVVEELSKKRI